VAFFVYIYSAQRKKSDVLVCSLLGWINTLRHKECFCCDTRLAKEKSCFCLHHVPHRKELEEDAIAFLIWWTQYPYSHLSYNSHSSPLSHPFSLANILTLHLFLFTHQLSANIFTNQPPSLFLMCSLLFNTVGSLCCFYYIIISCDSPFKNCQPCNKQSLFYMYRCWRKFPLTFICSLIKYGTILST
jgi:hypothetical protein